MIEQELRNIWKNSSQAERIKFDISRLLIDLDGKMKRIEKAIRNRDIREIGATFIGIPLFAYLTYAVPFTIPKIAGGLTVLWFFYAIYKFRSVQKARIPEDFTRPLNEQLENQKTNMRAQHRLLDTVLYWYVLPPFILNMVFIWGLDAADTLTSEVPILDQLPMDLNGKILFSVGITGFNIFVVWLNKRAVKKTLSPLIADITRIQNQLKQED